VFVPSIHFLSAKKEKAEYDLHRNTPADQGYRKFLNRIFMPMQKRLAPGSRGLDFGCGPGPTLSLMFEEIGHSVAIYDQFYEREASVLKGQYDFITATEVVEHLHDPRKELDRLWSCLKPGGSLGVMTKLVLDRKAFARWHYKNDLTHVCFFSRSTFEWLATRWQAELTFSGKDVVIFLKGDHGNRKEALCLRTGN
jgi:2-polyprenyl-3-methyl-5-hydroxy-6-metoxy-1,4-benzoquinol methylase